MTDTISTQTESLAILTILGGFVFVLLAIMIIWYVFQALGLYTMAKNRGIKHSWFAWIPYLQNYLFGELINDKVWGIGGAKWILVIAPILVTWGNTAIATDTTFFTIFSIVSFIYYVYLQFANYKLFKEYSNHALGYTIWSIFLPFLAPIFIFISRKNPYHPVD